jgi:two-component system, LuxR family, response regulator FixJ
MAAQEAMIETGSHNAVSPSAVQPTIYVVDDDVGVLGSLRFLLETEGFSVRTFRSAAALLSVERSDGVDCLLIDYKMPDMNGIDLVRRLRKRGNTAAVILMTGYPDEKISERAAAAGIKRVLKKPLLEDSMIRDIHLAIEENQASDGAATR